MSALAENEKGTRVTSRRQSPLAAGTTAVLLATMPAAGGGPAAALVWEDGTLLARLLEQLAGLGVTDLHVITRPQWAPALEPLLATSGAPARLHASEGAAADLLALAEVAQAARGPVVVAYGELATQREVLAGLLADPRVANAALITAGPMERPYAFRTRARGGRLLAAASPYHAVRVPNASFLGVLKIGPADRARIVEVARHLADLLAGPLPPAWEQELSAKADRWRRWLGRHGETLSPEDEAELSRRLACAPDDVTALLLVGLVRGGVLVGLSRLRGLFWARPLSEAGIQRAQEEIFRHDEERALFASTVKLNDGFFTTFFVSPYSKYLARWCARRGLTPNAVTLTSAAVGALTAAAFASGGRAGLVAGALLLQVAFTLDCVDGQLARYTRTFSKFGAWLDSIFDRTKEYLVFAGLAIGASRAGEPVWGLAAGMLALQTARHAVDFSYPAVRRQRFALAPQPPIEQPLDGPGRAHELPAEDLDELEPVAAAERDGLLPRLLALWKTGDRSGKIVWAKKLAAFPIGERFAVISVTAALFSPRTTFLVLLAWGGFAAAYILSGRILRSLAA